MMCQCRFTTSRKCQTLEGDDDNGDPYACVGARDLWKTSVLSSQFFSESKTALKK